MGSVNIWVSGQSSDLLNVVPGYAGKSVNSIAQLLPEGVYTTIRTYNRTMCLAINRHFDRLEESARILGSDLQIDRKLLRHNLRVAINNISNSNLRIRIHIPLIKEPEQIYIITEALTEPTQIEVMNGVKVITSPMQRSSAMAKATSFITTAERIRSELPEGLNEVVMVGEGNIILEGLSSNFFAVINGVVWTADEGILKGITREVVLQTLQDVRVPIQLRSVRSDEVLNVDEAFLTSTSRGVLPVTEIDNHKIGSGSPGPITTQIRKAFDERISNMIEEI